MFESFVITLREGVEAALAIGVIVVLLNKTGRPGLTRWVYAGLWLALAASVAGAYLFQRVKVSEELFEGTLMLVAAVFVGSMAIWMATVARSLKQVLETQAQSLAQAGAGAGIGLLGFSFFLVFREGVETALFLSAVTLNSDALQSAAGSVLGVAAAVAFGVLFVKGTVRIDLGKFFAVTGVVLILLVIQLLLGGYHELAEGGYWPSSAVVMALIGPVVKNNGLFALALAAIPLLLFIIPGRKEQADSAALETLEGPARRKLLADRVRDRRWRLAAAVGTLLVFCALFAEFAYSRSHDALPAPDMLTPSGGRVRVPLSALPDTGLHRFGVTLGGATVRFILLKSETGAVASALDACEICGAYGYTQKGPAHVRCRNCDSEINIATIGQSGGCNPIPLASRVEGRDVVIDLSALAPAGAMFGASQAPAGPEVVDPVCGMRLHPETAAGRTTYQGRTYYFCAMPSCRASFDKNPGAYARGR